MFLVSDLAFEVQEGDLITRASVAYEVTDVAKARRDKVWRVTAERAFLNTSQTVTADVERATNTLDAASAASRSWAAVYSSQDCAVAQDDNTADMIARLGVRADKTATTFYFAQSLDILPTDRIKYGGRYYRLTYQGEQGRIARLQYARGELYA